MKTVIEAFSRTLLLILLLFFTMFYTEQTHTSTSTITIKAINTPLYNGYLIELSLHDIKQLQLIEQEQTTLEAYNIYPDILIAINGIGVPLSNTVINGELIKPFTPSPHSWEQFIGFNTDGYLIGGRLTTEQQLIEMNPYIGVSFGPQLISKGYKLNNDSITREPRTAVGQKSNKNIVFLIIDGRSKASFGATLSDLEDIFIQHNVIEAYNLCGGGSTTLVYNNTVMNNPSDGELRVLSNNFVVRDVGD